jgi:3-oxoacyl-[acyl-carrier protein] reductase
MKLENKVAIVTGGGRGIGKATALALAREKVKVVVVSRTLAEIENVAGEITKQGGEALAIAADVSQKFSVDAMVSQTLARFGKIDILVNNAGVALHNPIPKIREEEWDMTIVVNLKGVFLCTQAVFSKMCEQGYGHIINVSSSAGKHGGANFGAYAASKFGVVGFTESTHNEGIPYGVKATVVCPGPTDTKMRRDNHKEDLTKIMLPEDIADVILFILSQPARAHIQEVVVSAPLYKEDRMILEWEKNRRET